MLKLREAIFSVTNRCNLKCRMCDIPLRRADDLPTAVWLKAVDDAAEMGAPTVVFSGGEPLLREDIFSLVERAKKKGMRVCLTSNGILIDRIKAGRIASCGVDFVNISIEGDEKTNDHLRGCGSFALAVGALGHLRKCPGVFLTIATVVSKYNYKLLPFIADLAYDSGVKNISLQPFGRIFLNDVSGGEDFFLSMEEKHELDDIMPEFMRRCRDHGININPEGYLKIISGYLSGEKVSPVKSCPALFDSCSVNSSGDVFPCWVMAASEYLIGNIASDDLSAFWGSKKHHDIRESVVRRGCPGCLMSCYEAACVDERTQRGFLGSLKKACLGPLARLRQCRLR